MGELPENVFCFGAPGLDNIHRLKLLDIKKLTDELEIPGNAKIGIVTFHPVTLEKNLAECHIAEIIEAIKNFTEIYWVFTLPNADTEGRSITEKINNFVSEFPEKGRVFISLGQLRYLSLLKNAVLMVGNSSSGLVEAPSVELPVVNIGDRQRGRVRGKNVIDVPECKKEPIINSIYKALSPDFRNSLKGMKNPYGEGNASEKIVKILKTISLGEGLTKKTFYEIQQ